MTEQLSVPCPQKASPAVCYSVDLTFRFLPDLTRLARAASEDDPLVKLEAGKDTAKHIPGAKLVTIPGWGHDLPVELVDRLADEIVLHARAARAATPVAT